MKTLVQSASPTRSHQHPLPLSARSRLVDLAVTEAPLIIAVACSAAVLFGHLATQFAADSWLNLVSGREIVDHGLPRHDVLAVVSRGHEWIDQQWLAHVFYYGAYLVGGLSLAARLNIIAFLIAVVGVYWFARRRGATPIAVAVGSVPMLIVGIDFIRAQVLAEPLFVALVALLASQSRRPTRRVTLAFPILVLWANIHGSVVLGAGLVTALGLVELSRGARLRPVALVLLPWACVFASPYGSSLLTYYRATLHNPEFARHLTEWASPKFASVAGILLLATALAAVALIARRPRELTRFELAVLAVAFLGAVQAVRSIVWFVIAAAMLLPGLLGGAREEGHEPGLSVSQRAVVALAAAVATFLALFSVAHPGPAIANDWPPGASRAVEDILRSDPHARVLAGYDVADWVLFDSAASRGRIAFDGRWEILTRSEFLAAMHVLGPTGTGGRGYRVLVARPTTAGTLVRWYLRRPTVRVRYRSDRLIVLDLGRTGDPQP